MQTRINTTTLLTRLPKNIEFIRKRSLTQSISNEAAQLTEESQLPPKVIVQYPYFVPRNSLGSLPVYSDIKNAGTKRLVHIRNVEGDIKTLKEDLVETLFPPGHDKRERQRLQKKAKIHLNRHIILSGGRWAPLVQKWLLARGF